MMGFLSFKKQRQEVEGQDTDLVQESADQADTNRAELELYRRAFDKIKTTCQQAAGGDLEARLTEIEEFGDLAETMSSINHVLDMADAFVREAGASLQAANDGKFFREFMVRGILGDFRRGAQVINDARQSMEAAAAESARLFRMIEDMPINVMMADAETLNITYLNTEAKKTLTTLQEHLSVKADDLMGQCIDIFHKEPGHQRRILTDPANLPHRATITLGNENLKLEASAVMGHDGSYIGPMLCWSVVTDQIRIATDVKEVVEVVASSSTEMKASSESLAAAAEETAAQSTTVAAASEEVTANIQTVASAAEQLAASVHEVSSQVSDSARISQEAVTETERTNQTVQGLAEAAQKIGDVVSLISDIAGQTNLLALNATIEAARAGEAGKGFAVVASEVKSLATQTAKATEDIASQIGAIQGATKDAVSAIQGIGQTIGRISEIATSISSAVEQQSAATSEISRNVQEASNGTQEVSSNITGVSTSASESGQSAGQVLSAAESLANEGEQMRQKVDEFLASL